ncbi:BDNF/NT-3 growth factors receptor-like [Haemaphysalis longicornis]
MAQNGTGEPPQPPAHSAPAFTNSDVLRKLNLGGPRIPPAVLRPAALFDGQELDLCAHNSTLCGPEAGCHNVNGTFACVCTSDLKPKRPHEPCSAAPVAQSNDFPQSSPRQPHPAGSFTHHQIAGMNRNYTPIAKGQPGAASAEPWRPPGQVAPESLLTGLLAVLGSLALAAIVLAVLVRRHRRRAAEARRAAAGSLQKCVQHYVTNPTYYSSAPETPLRKVLHDVEISADCIRFVEEIGEGCFGKVHKAVYTRPDGSEEDVAVKVLKETVSSEAQADFEREVQIMSSFKHENILELLGVVFKESGSIPWMVFEFMTYGDLAELLRAGSYGRDASARKATIQLTLSDLPWVATQIASGMCYLSSQHFVHRDLATRNCLVGNNLCVKISDFGMSRDIYTCDYYKIRGSRMLPVRWMAPESIMYGKFTLESDVWSYGVVLWEIFTFGKQPYYGHSNEDVVKLILQGILLSPPEECPPHVCTVMAGCWKTEPRDRLTFDEIYKRLLDTFPPPLPPPQHDEPELLDDELDSEDYLVPKAPPELLHHLSL